MALIVVTEYCLQERFFVTILLRLIYYIYSNFQQIKKTIFNIVTWFSKMLLDFDPHRKQSIVSIQFLLIPLKVLVYF